MRKESLAVTRETVARRTSVVSRGESATRKEQRNTRRKAVCVKRDSQQPVFSLTLIAGDKNPSDCSHKEGDNCDTKAGTHSHKKCCK